MSTRVQKGGPVFRPVAKPRGRSTTGNTSRQSSVAADLRGSGASSSSTDVIPPGSLASMAMPPPTVIPSTTNSTNPETGSFRSGRAAPPVLSTNASSSSVPADNIIVSDFRPSPSPAASIIAPPRNGHIPVSAGQTSGPSRLSASQVDSTPTSITSGLPPSEFRHMTFNQVLMAHTPNQNEGLNSSSFPGHIGSSAHHIENATLADELVSQGEPSGGDDLLQRPESRRKSTRGKGALSAGAEVNGNNLEAVSTKPRKSSRPKRSRNSETENTEIQPEDPIPQEARGNVPEHVVGPTNYKRKRRSSSSAPRKPRKTRQPSATPFDPDADPGEELDPTTVTMATLCRDTGQGRISTKAVQIQTNHAAWKASNREKRARMKILMESKKYGKKEGAEEVVPNPENRPADDNAEAGPSNHSTSGSVRAPSSGPPPEDETGHGFDYSESMATSRFNVQVRIGPNGETIIDEESLFVDRVEGDDSANYTHVEESDTTKFVNSATYGKKFRGSRWSAEETELFFDALSQFGENYELISYVLPGRDRKACKNKFKAEDKRNSARITHCLNNRIPYDMQTLSRMTGKDFSGPTPEIRAPVKLSLEESEQIIPEATSTSATKSSRKKSTTPGIASDGAEVIGDVAEFEQDDD